MVKSLENLCARETPATTSREIIGWWESRRIPFNLIVGSAGILTCMIVGIVGLGSEILFSHEFGFPDPPIIALLWIALYAILANVCFTFGWIAELFVNRVWKKEADSFAKLSFSAGLLFAVLLTLLPGVLFGVGGLFALVRHFTDGSHSG